MIKLDLYVVDSKGVCNGAQKHLLEAPVEDIYLNRPWIYPWRRRGLGVEGVHSLRDNYSAVRPTSELVRLDVENAVLVLILVLVVQCIIMIDHRTTDI